ncbi:hypothetical protein PIB30_060195 [Stylosanthes scabra]|uniref:Uncharacterized protein n=1 Tax=Stylosanthes scabra TaxID=79078 RepID=A0ABU6WLN3_9FABA|nr:hypothetical protein [Stylosanthes scabra]
MSNLRIINKSARWETPHHELCNPNSSQAAPFSSPPPPFKLLLLHTKQPTTINSIATTTSKHHITTTLHQTTITEAATATFYHLAAVFFSLNSITAVTKTQITIHHPNGEASSPSTQPPPSSHLADHRTRRTHHRSPSSSSPNPSSPSEPPYHSRPRHRCPNPPSNSPSSHTHLPNHIRPPTPQPRNHHLRNPRTTVHRSPHHHRSFSSLSHKPNPPNPLPPKFLTFVHRGTTTSPPPSLSLSLSLFVLCRRASAFTFDHRRSHLAIHHCITDEQDHHHCDFDSSISLTEHLCLCYRWRCSCSTPLLR